MLAAPVVASALLDTLPGTRTWEQIRAFILGTIYTVGGVIITTMFIIAGIMFLVASGDPEKVKTARQTALYAVVGVVVMLISVSILPIVVSFLG